MLRTLRIGAKQVATNAAARMPFDRIDASVCAKKKKHSSVAIWFVRRFFEHLQKANLSPTRYKCHQNANSAIFPATAHAMIIAAGRRRRERNAA